MYSQGMLIFIFCVAIVAVLEIIFDGVNGLKNEIRILTKQNNQLRDGNIQKEKALFQTLRNNRANNTIYCAYAGKYEEHQISDVRYELIKSNEFDTPYRECFGEKHIIIDTKDGSRYIGDDIGTTIFFDEEQAKRVSNAPCQIPGYQIFKFRSSMVYRRA